MTKNRRKIAMVVAIVLAVLMIVPAIVVGVLSLMPEASAAVTQKDIENSKKLISDLKAKKAKTEAEIKELKNLQADVFQRKALYDEQIATIEEEIAANTALIADLNLAIAERQQTLDEARQNEEKLRTRYVERVRAMESIGDISYLSMILQAESLTDMLTRWDDMREIMESDQKLIEEFTKTRLEIEASIAQLDADKQEQYNSRCELTDAQNELAALSAETDAMIADYMAEMSKLQAQEKDQEKNLNAAQKELDDQQAAWKKYLEDLERQKKATSTYVGGKYQWPVAGYYNISSGFGYRIHPIYKVKKRHTGIDIPAPKGTKISAANKGTVITRTYSSGYGNYIIIDHGGGQATLYAHMSGFAVKAGDEVAVGQTIGYVGSTGVSTGNHLHFEIRIDGTPVDPEKSGYLKK